MIPRIVQNRFAGDQVIEQADLVGSQFLGNQVGDNIEVGPLRQEISSGLVIFHRRRVKRQAAGIFIEAEHHHGRLVGAQLDVCAMKRWQKTVTVEPTASMCSREPCRPPGFAGMMIVDVDIDPGPLGNCGKGPDTGGLTDIDQDQAGDLLQIDVADTLEAEGILRALQEELAQAALLAAGKHHDGIRVEPLGGDHRPEAIEIGVDMGGDDVHLKPETRDAGRGTRQNQNLHSKCSLYNSTSENLSLQQTE